MTKTVLIVDDHADIRRLIRMTLEIEAYEIHEAANAVSALRMVRELRPDFVLMDVMMPGEFDGLEACRRMRADPALVRVQVILLSAMGQAADRAAGLQAGALSYIAKPFSPLKLIATLAAAGAAVQS